MPAAPASEFTEDMIDGSHYVPQCYDMCVRGWPQETCTVCKMVWAQLHPHTKSCMVCYHDKMVRENLAVCRCRPCFDWYTVCRSAQSQQAQHVSSSSSTSQPTPTAGGGPTPTSSAPTLIGGSGGVSGVPLTSGGVQLEQPRESKPPPPNCPPPSKQSLPVKPPPSTQFLPVKPPPPEARTLPTTTAPPPTNPYPFIPSLQTPPQTGMPQTRGSGDVHGGPQTTTSASSSVSSSGGDPRPVNTVVQRFIDSQSTIATKVERLSGEVRTLSEKMDQVLSILRSLGQGKGKGNDEGKGEEQGKGKGASSSQGKGKTQYPGKKGKADTDEEEGEEEKKEEPTSAVARISRSVPAGGPPECDEEEM